MVDLNKYVQELLGNLLETMVEMYELPSGDMSIEQGKELAHIRDRLANFLEEFVGGNR